MSNLLAQAINCDDPTEGARIIEDALGIVSDDVVNYRLNDAPVTSGSGSKPKRVTSLVTEIRRSRRRGRLKIAPDELRPAEPPKRKRAGAKPAPSPTAQPLSPW